MGWGTMKRSSQASYSKPAQWVVATRIRERQLGYRAVQVLRFIRDRIEAGGAPPSYREICEEFGLDRGNLHRLIVSLETHGKVARFPRPDRRTPIIRLIA